MLYSLLFTPRFHGPAGILDELLLFCLPLVVVVIILAIASRRARQRVRPVAPDSGTPADDAKPSDDA